MAVLFLAAAIKAKCAFMMSSKDVAKVMKKVRLTGERERST
jgi:hypothetical protein